MLAAKTMTKKVAALTAWSAVAEASAGGILFHIFYKAGEGVCMYPLHQPHLPVSKINTHFCDYGTNNNKSINANAAAYYSM